MLKEETKILRYLDWIFFLVFVPIIIFLIPTNRIMERDPNFFALMMCYMVAIHIVNRKFNFVTYIFRSQYNKAVATICIIGLITYIVSLIRISDERELSSEISNGDVKELRNRVLFTLLFIDLSFNVMLALVIELFRQKIEKKSIETEKSRAELAIYKSQINPHFMFNTLNTIYALNFTHSDKTGEVIMKFSNIVKYIYQNSDKEMIMISEEVKYLREFIELHSLRLSEQTTVNFTSEVDDNSEYVPSMIFITFVENLFKYGVSSSSASSIDIAISLCNKELVFTTHNTIFLRGDRKNSSGIGIENCRKRLSLLYPDRYSLECVENGDKYKTSLKIML